MNLRKAIAIDFDGCLCSDKYPDIGEPNWAVIYRAKQGRRRGGGPDPLDLPGGAAPSGRFGRL